MNPYTIVGIHDSGLGLIVHAMGDDATEAFKKFEALNCGVALVVLDGHLKNLVPRNLWPHNGRIL